MAGPAVLGVPEHRVQPLAGAAAHHRKVFHLMGLTQYATLVGDEEAWTLAG